MKFSRVFLLPDLVFGAVFGASLAQAIDAEDIGEKGIKALSEGNLIQAMDLLEQSSQQGYAPAQATLAYILDKAEEDARAFELYRRAAEQGNPAGQHGLAGMYAKGEGTEQNLQTAGQWMQKAAQQEYRLAMRDYAIALQTGDLGLTKDPQQAQLWFQKCHRAGDTVCTRHLAEAYRDGGLGLAKDEKKAAALFEKLNKKPED